MIERPGNWTRLSSCLCYPLIIILTSKISSEVVELSFVCLKTINFCMGILLNYSHRDKNRKVFVGNQVGLYKGVRFRASKN